MANIIYHQTADALIPQGNRTVSTFPSGLIRVDQSFIGLTSLQSTHRSTLELGNDFPGDHNPAIDGLKIYPAPQEKRLPTGFTEYLVSAYGRTSLKAGDIKNRYRRGLLGSSIGFSFLETQATSVVTYAESYRFENTGLTGEYYPVRPFDTNPIPESPLKIASFFEETATVADTSGVVFNLNVYTAYLAGFSFRYSSPFLIALDVKNYGYFSELTFRTSINYYEAFSTFDYDGVFFS